MKSLFVMVMISCMFNVSLCDIYSSMVGWEELFKTELEIVSTIDEYLDNQQWTIEQLKKIRQHYIKCSNDANNVGYKYVMNPVNAFLLIKRLTMDWDYVKILMGDQMSEADQLNTPETGDLTGAAIALLQLQDIYGLSVRDVLEGKVSKRIKSEKMTANDCALMARIAYVNKKYSYCTYWTKSGIRLLTEDQDEPIPTNEMQLQTLLSACLYEEAENALQTAQNYAPDGRTLGELPAIREQVFSQQNKTFGRWATNDGEIPVPMEYNRLCRQKIMKRPFTVRSRCYYKADLPFLKLAPLKVEGILSQPKVQIFRDIISDNEMRFLTDIARPILEKSQIHHVGEIEGWYSYKRIGKEATLSRNLTIVSDIQRRIEMITDLNMGTSDQDEFFIANYGIGGQFSPHYDFMGNARAETRPLLGERFASVIFYMSEPEFGGNTVFPILDIAVPPSLNDALFFINFDNIGNPDYRTLHAGCPVVSGDKWIAVSFIAEKAQTQCLI